MVAHVSCTTYAIGDALAPSVLMQRLLPLLARVPAVETGCGDGCGDGCSDGCGDGDGGGREGTKGGDEGCG